MTPSHNTPDLTDHDIAEWVDLLGTTGRRDLVQGLLDHASGDEMTLFDKMVCIRAIRLIDKGVILDDSH